MDSNTVIALLFLLGGILGFVYIIFDDRRSHRSQLSTLAMQWQGEFIAGPVFDANLYARWYEQNIIQWQCNGYSLRYFESISDPNNLSTAEAQPFVTLYLNKPLPAFKLLKYTLEGQQNLNDDDFLTDFNQAYNVYSMESVPVDAIFTAAMQQYFADNSQYSLECDGSRLIGYKMRERIPVEEIDALAQWLTLTADKLEKEVADG